MFSIFITTIVLFRGYLISAIISSGQCQYTHDSVPIWKVDCSKLNFSEVPDEVIVDPVHSLSLNHNNIEFLQNLENWPFLRSLDLSFNQIYNLTNTTFKSQKYLNYLNLSFNSIHFISEETFQILPFLQTLDLSYNTKINLFSSCKNNKGLRLFSGILSSLYLKSMSLEKLPFDIFKNLYYLDELHLNNNKLETLPPLPKSLLFLDLSHNLFKEINYDFFQKSFNIEYLNLEYNKNIIEIKPKVFDKLNKLKTLSVKGCSHLQFLPKDITKLTGNLKSLSIAECNFETLSTEFKVFLNNLEHLEMHDNPWVCNSSIKWFIQIIPNNTPERFRCASPRNTTIEEFFKMKLEHHILRYSLTTITLLGCLCLVVSLLIGIYIESKRRSMSNPYTLLERPLTESGGPIYISTVA